MGRGGALWGGAAAGRWGRVRRRKAREIARRLPLLFGDVVRPLRPAPPSSLPFPPQGGGGGAQRCLSAPTGGGLSGGGAVVSPHRAGEDPEGSDWAGSRPLSGSLLRGVRGVGG